MKYQILGWNFWANASGYLPEVYDTRADAEQGVKENEWIMDDWEIVEIHENQKEEK